MVLHTKSFHFQLLHRIDRLRIMRKFTVRFRERVDLSGRPLFLQLNKLNYSDLSDKGVVTSNFG